MQFELPIVYKNSGIPPKCRSPQDYKVIDKAWFDFPVADPSELEPALTFRLRYRREDGELLISDTVFHQYQGHLMRDIDASPRLRDQTRLNVETLSQMASDGVRWLPDILKVKSTQFWYSYSSGYEAGILKDKHIEDSGRNAAVDELQAFITDNLVIVDGVVYAKNHDPKINVHIGGDGYSVDLSLVASGDYSFPFDRMDLVDRFASWLESECGIARKNERSWHSDCEFLVDAPTVPLSANPVLEAGLKLASMAQLNIANAAYWGEDTKRLGLALQAEPTVENVFAFADAFEAAAMLPDAHKIGYGMENHAHRFASFRKFVELMPDEYKQDFADTIDIPVSFSAQYSSPRS
ncbi:hypothetical protein FHT76_000656 [Rhizobium sp. BK176]|nr:hypothetical protein [Rhizobium sp. BK176]